MDLQTRKISFVQEFLRLQNEEIVSLSEQILRRRKAELLDGSLVPMSGEQLNEEIDRALEDPKNDTVISAKDLKNEIKKWRYTNSQYRSTRSTCSFSALLLRGGRPVATATQRPPRIVLRKNSGASWADL